MNWILIIVAILIIGFLIQNYSLKNKRERLKSNIRKNWGRKKSEAYYDFHAIKKYHSNSGHLNSLYHSISERTSLDLDLDDVFKFIDRTISKVGQQFLYYKIRTIDSVDKLMEFDKLSKLFLKNDELRFDCQVVLSSLSSNNAYDLEGLINEELIKKPKFLPLIYASSIASGVFLILALFKPLFFFLLIPLFVINFFYHYRNKKYINYYTSSVGELVSATKVGNQLSGFEEISQYFGDLSFMDKLNDIRGVAEFVGFEKKLDNEFLMLFWLVIELIKVQFMIEYIIFYSFIDSITKEKKSIDDLFRFIGEVDCAISTASLKVDSLGSCEPEFTQGKDVVIKAATHPLIEDCVANNLSLNSKSLLLTGSNMSGKTTFIRTVAVNSILAQTLNVCFAKAYSAPYFKLYSSIRISDDLLEETSYYLKEVLNIGELMDASKSNAPCLFILDEIFKGTNTVERIAGGKAILSYLNQKNHTVLVSTHDIELAELLEKEGYDLAYFSESIENEALHFDHKLKPGKLRTRNAIKILELYDYPVEVIADARKVIDDAVR